ncbi:hypothetical protein [Salipiger sp. PrR003]|uniref:hypothetical protein n=1 Tax=Salipiger sp. PrR003 TaxID=2706776 RepID=UPI0013DCFF32|nr:hypothetical protein [Salipiger sp. PrR003]NDV52931.1 hypothetical protein [Salipiger sp. PrR003]
MAMTSQQRRRMRPLVSLRHLRRPTTASTELEADLQESSAVEDEAVEAPQQAPERAISTPIEAAPAPEAQEHGNALLEAFKGMPPCYIGHVKLLRWGHTSSSGMSLTIELLDADQDESHPFKGLRAARGTKTEGQRLRVHLAHSEHLSQTPGELVYAGESLLIWWAEDCAEGMKVTLRLDEGPDGAGQIHPCDGMSHGKKSGEILSLVVWPIDDEDQPDVPGARRKRRSFDELSPTAQSQILCNDERFSNWLAKWEDRFVSDFACRADLDILRGEDAKAYAEHVLKIWCGIESRAELTHDTDRGSFARDRWARMLEAYQEERWRRSS